MDSKTKLPTPQSEIKSFKLPVWGQLAISGVLLATVLFMAFRAGLYSSVWDEENSNFYSIALQALQMNNVHPSSPTLIVFWEKSCAPCKNAIQAMDKTPASTRMYGVHLSVDDSEVGIRQAWLDLAPPSSQLIIDKQQLLQTAFHVRSVPMAFIILPKQKKIYSFLGDLGRNPDRMLDIIDSEY